MKVLLAAIVTGFSGALVTSWLFLGPGSGTDSVNAAPAPRLAAAPGGLVVHEWGTFTSFSGSDGVPAGFRPNNADLPDFVYRPAGAEDVKGVRLARFGTVSMETPVIYFYAAKETRVSVPVD